MATTTNYGWTTPDDTALVKDGAAAIRSLGTAIDTTVFNNAGVAIAKTIVDAKGDLIVGTAADTVARLASSASNGDLLTVDTSTASGLKWAAPAGSGGMTLLSTTSLTSGSSVTISTINQSHKHLLLVITDVTCSGDFYLDVKPNNTTNLKGAMIENRSTSNINYDATNAISIGFATAQKASGGDISTAIDIYNYASTTLKKHVRATYLYVTGSTTLNGSGHVYGTFTSSAVSSLSINTSSTFTAGTALLYGVS